MCPGTTRRCPTRAADHESEAPAWGWTTRPNEATEAKGKAKETAGSATDNESLEAEGKADQGEAKVKKAGEHLKDAAERRQGHLQELSGRPP